MKIYRYCYKLKTYQLVVLGILLPFIFDLIINVLYDYLNITGNPVDDEQLRVTIPTLVAMISFGPLIETLFFQYLPLKIGHDLFKRYKYHYYIIILLSSIIFAAVHPHEPAYLTAMLFAGLIWSFICLIFIRKKQYPVLYLTLIHAGYNCIMLIGRMFMLDFNLIK